MEVQAVDVAAIADHLDHHSKEFGEDPWAVYAYLRSTSPVKWSDQHGGFWIITNYEDVHAVASDDARFSSADGVTIPSSSLSPMIPIEMDQPQATMFRRLLLPYFTPAAISKREDEAHSLANKLLDAVSNAGRLDFMDDYAGPIPAIMTLRLLGVPDNEWRRFAEPVHEAIFREGFDADPSKEERILGEFLWMSQRFMELLEERRATPKEDILSHLAFAEVEGRALTVDECLKILFLILFGGVDTTTMAIGNALVYLDRNPDRRQELLKRPELLESAVEEFLRYEAPQQMLARTAKVDCELGGQKISAGDRLQICWASANRDPKAFDRPDELLFDRDANRHTTFGVGAHRCLGSHLARIEFRVALQHVLERIPNYKVDWSNAKRGDSVGTVYGYYKLPATF
jgi:cytochrome P450